MRGVPGFNVVGKARPACSSGEGGALRGSAGEPRSVTDPANRPFLDSVARGECPAELEPSQREQARGRSTLSQGSLSGRARLDVFQYPCLQPPCTGARLSCSSRRALSCGTATQLPACAVGHAAGPTRLPVLLQHPDTRLAPASAQVRQRSLASQCMGRRRGGEARGKPGAHERCHTSEPRVRAPGRPHRPPATLRA